MSGELFQAFCPKCGYKTYTKTWLINNLRFSCSCGCAFSLNPKYAERM